MTNHLSAIVDLVVRHGGDPARTRTIVEYIADRICTLQLATALSSPHSSLRRDPYLVVRQRMQPEEIAAIVKLLRGTRTVVKRDGTRVGGRPGMLELLVRGTVTPADGNRFAKLAGVAAAGCRRSQTAGPRLHHARTPNGHDRSTTQNTGDARPRRSAGCRRDARAPRDASQHATNGDAP